MIVVLLVVLVLFVVAVRRRRRRIMLSGLTSARPQFMVTPPLRRLTDRREDRL